MDISLTPEHERFIEKQLKEGRYYCASEVIRDALQLLEDRAAMNQMRLKKIKTEIMIGIEASERGEVSDGEEFIKELLEEISEAEQLEQ